MNERHCQRISLMDFDVNLVVRNDKNDTIISFSGNVKNTITYCACEEDSPGILLHVPACVIQILRLVNN